MLSPMNALSELLLERREDAGMSQRAVARALGVSPQTYVWWERGAVTPKATAAGELASWLGLSKGDVLVALGILEPGETVVRAGGDGISLAAGR
jgi:transcriptional regulator with XRE-family HTH domain